MDKVHGIQHIGVAVSQMERSLIFYRKVFGMNIPFFDSIQAAPLMQVFTRQEVVTKRASMVMNLKGGSAMEIIQATSFTPRPMPADFLIGDLGIFALHMRAASLPGAKNLLQQQRIDFSDEVADPLGKGRLALKDPDGQFIIIVEDDQLFEPTTHPIGGVGGISIGVSDINTAKAFYALLGFDQVLYEGQANYDDLKGFPGGEQEVQRVILTTSQMAKGPFGAVIGYSLIELICTPQRIGQKIFRGRIWGDVGFVHIGLDVFDMRGLADVLAQKNIQFKCDSQAALSMGKTQVHCAYVVDPDGILIELIEVYKIPLIEKWGIFLNVHGKKAGKALPNWLIRLLRFSRIKD
jgi:catechol 2,3-dioxygenase-like lactoylglutathione lyase family enzyme